MSNAIEKNMRLSVSWNNAKMGKIPSVSLTPIITCHARCMEACARDCYACHMERFRKTLAAAWARNFTILNNSRDSYFMQAAAAACASRFFRWHVGGDIVDADYFSRMVKLAELLPETVFLAFTKCFEIVNDYIAANGALPGNLRIIFSGWNYDIPNPYNLPEAHVIFKDGSTTARPDAKKCNGDCTECAMCGDGCWTLKHGEQVVFDIH